MKLGEGGEAFFVFETTDEIPASLQTSPLVSPAGSPRHRSEENLPDALQEPDYLDLDKSSSECANDLKPGVHMLSNDMPTSSSDLGMIAHDIGLPFTHEYRNYYSLVAVTGGFQPDQVAPRLIGGTGEIRTRNFGWYSFDEGSFNRCGEYC